eukprot:CAMPEP_0168613338 /NCGR_PEP_ID=MMETSP0449_2-20121227/3398_1 /TAXON_ID=1082188 /ORGANISM="Strombidium rassoulzadegani, Strain ras09" /LENGTH=77 /DNA_ID=CAMNT_0008653965 /DNA_START=81 /DNA_END=314 /DNA_ORIENTATION=-
MNSLASQMVGLGEQLGGERKEEGKLVVRGDFLDWMNSDYFEFIQIGIYFVGGILTLTAVWSTQYLVQYLASPSVYDF